MNNDTIKALREAETQGGAKPIRRAIAMVKLFTGVCLRHHALQGFGLADTLRVLYYR